MHAEPRAAIADISFVGAPPFIRKADLHAKLFGGTSASTLKMLSLIG